MVEGKLTWPGGGTRETCSPLEMESVLSVPVKSPCLWAEIRSIISPDRYQYAQQSALAAWTCWQSMSLAESMILWHEVGLSSLGIRWMIGRWIGTWACQCYHLHLSVDGVHIYLFQLASEPLCHTSWLRKASMPQLSWVFCRLFGFCPPSLLPFATVFLPWISPSMGM